MNQPNPSNNPGLALPLQFKYRPIANGRAQSFLAKKGELSEGALTLADERIPLETIGDTTVRDNRLILMTADGNARVIEVYKVGALALERTLDRLASARQAKAQQAALEAKGEGHLFRAMTCPLCAATIDLTGQDKGSYIHCRYCESVLDRDGRQVVSSGLTHKTCDDCGMFGHIKSYTEFYFYFLLVVYGFSYKRRFLCATCAGRLFWKVLLINLIFVLGVIPAIVLKLKSLVGGDPRYAPLARANALARKGTYREADLLYQEMLRGQQEHPGLLLNQAMGHLNGGDPDNGVALLKRSLKACPNYVPTINLVSALAQAAEQPEQGAPAAS